MKLDHVSMIDYVRVGSVGNKEKINATEGYGLDADFTKRVVRIIPPGGGKPTFVPFENIRFFWSAEEATEPAKK